MTENPIQTTSPAVRLPRRSAQLALIFAILASSIGCDRATKIVADTWLYGAGRISLLGDVLRVDYARNSGAFLGLGASFPEPVRRFIFIGCVGAVVVVMLIFAFGRNRPLSQVVAASLLASGGIGNLWDRIVGGGAVTDFLNLGIGPVLRTAIFNVADLAIVAGAVLLALSRNPQRAGAPQDAPPAGPSA